MTQNLIDSETVGVSIVIPNYNGEDLLKDNIPSVITALDKWGAGEIIIVDDCSSDNSVSVVTELFPRVRLIVNPVNKGFSGTCNVGMEAALFPISICMNTDVKVSDNFIAPLVKRLTSASDIFAVTPQTLVEREGKNQGAVISRFTRGFIRGGFIAMDEKLAARENLYAVGACAAYNLEKFKALGGYNEVYAPFLFEDVDISYRAWKRGWKSIYEPESVVWHYSNATIYKDKKKAKRGHIIYFRNRFIFHWVNLTDRKMLIQNIFNIFLRLLFSFLWFNFSYYRAFWGAIQRLEEIQELRCRENPHRKLTDAEVLCRTSSKY